jgi:molybdopterin-guanine dinucleotide biosynthesis adapter protein
MPRSERARDVTGVVIAGGRSSRMDHREKALLDLSGVPTLTAVISPSQWELAGELQRTPAPALDDIARRLGPADIVLVEGFKSAAIPKIEVRHLASRTRDPLAAGDPHVIAIAANHAVEVATVPVFALDDTEPIAAFIIASTGLKSA